MFLFNNVREHMAGWLRSYLITSKAFYISAQQTNEYLSILGLLRNIYFETDFQLLNSIDDIQGLFNSIRIKDVEDSNIEIRFLLDFATEIRTQFKTNEEYNDFIKELSILLSLHNTVATDKSAYDVSILQTLSQNTWLIYLPHNPWLVATIVIRYLPMEVIVAEFLDLSKVMPKEQ